MNRRIAHLGRLVAVPSLLMLGTMTAPAVSAGDPCFHGYEIPPASTGPGTDIKLMPCSFGPTVSTVAVGTEVTFFNGPDYTHMITGANQAWGSPEVELQPSATVSYTFDEPGIYPYACALHVGMSGAIVVGDLGDAVAAGSTNGSQTGGTTGTSAEDAGAGEVAPAGSAAETETASLTGLPLVALIALGTGAGMVSGAVAVWLAIRRRAR